MRETRGVLQIDLAAQRGMIEGAARGDVDGGAAVGGDAGVEGLQQLEVDVAFERGVDVARPAESGGSGGADIGVGGDQMELIDAGDLIAQREEDRPLAIDVEFVVALVDGDVEGGDVGGDGEEFGGLERAGGVDGAGDAGVSGEPWIGASRA